MLLGPQNMYRRSDAKKKKACPCRLLNPGHAAPCSLYRVNCARGGRNVAENVNSEKAKIKRKFRNCSL
jgi:hypothetical protein